MTDRELLELAAKAAEVGKSQAKPLTAEEFTKWVGDTWNECQEKAWKEPKP
jgi:hypothetical protein